MSTAISKLQQGAARRRSLREFLRTLPWIGPSLLLILGIVLFPTIYILYSSTRDISASGVDRGPVGFDNYVYLFSNPALGTVFLNSAIWVVGVVAATIILSLLIAQLLNSQFPGRKFVRMIVIIPWASSVVMTATVFTYGLNPFFGIMNRFMVDIGVIAEPLGFTQEPALAFPAAMFVAVFVSLPFTIYTMLAGLQTVSVDSLEAARMDGAGPIRTYFSIVFPQLRAAVAVATLVNMINVFNSLPILKLMTGSIPGNAADTTTTLVFKYIQSEQRIDTASALSVINLIVISVIVIVFVRVTKPLKAVDA